jgi:hypothetical protein
MTKHLKVRVLDGTGRVLAKIRVTIPKKYRRNKLDEWHGLTDAYASGVADGIAQQLEE